MPAFTNSEVYDMGFETSEIPRMEFSRHELFILKYAEALKPIPADQPTVDLLVDEGLISRTGESNINALTEIGRLACLVMRPQLSRLSAK